MVNHFFWLAPREFGMRYKELWMFLIGVLQGFKKLPGKDRWLATPISLGLS